jgi:hypothetical protein
MCGNVAIAQPTRTNSEVSDLRARTLCISASQVPIHPAINTCRGTCFYHFIHLLSLLQLKPFVKHFNLPGGDISILTHVHACTISVLIYRL